MGKEISICIDLGSDTLKVVCAYYNDSKKIITSKIVDSRYSEVAIPAVAIYDRSKSGDNAWSFGYQIGRNNEVSFATVVKIKDLLSIIKKEPSLTSENKDKTKSKIDPNQYCYTDGNIFPIFEFPITVTRPDKYYEFCADKRFVNMRFIAAGYTPRMVCELYFKYVAQLVINFLKEINDENYFTFDDKILQSKSIKYTLICPAKCGQEYIEEYERLVRYGFGLSKTTDINTYSSTKALGMMAVYKDDFGDSGDESALLFDIGEEQISVVKFNTAVINKKRTFSIDGISGHNEPQKLGGNNIDKAVVEQIENSIERRETVGSAAFGELGYVRESGLKSKDFLLMKSIKAAKIILGAPNSKKNYPEGALVSVVRDLEIFKNIKHEEFKKCIGIENKGKVSGVAKSIIDYITDELKTHKDVNRGVKKIYLSGGVVGTLGLVDAIKSAVNNIDCSMSVKTFLGYESKADNITGEYAIEKQDIFAYAPAVAGALVTLKNDKIDVILTKSYGVRMGIHKVYNSAHFDILVNRGASLDFNKKDTNDGGIIVDIKGKKYKEFSTMVGRNTCQGSDLTIYSTYITDNNLSQYDIQKRVHEGEGTGDFKIDYFYDDGDEANFSHTYESWRYFYLYFPVGADGGEPALKNLTNVLGFFPETGGAGTRVCFYYKNNPLIDISNVTPYDVDDKRIFYNIGVRIDKDGIVFPFASNYKPRNEDRYGDIVYMDKGREVNKRVCLTDLEIRFNKIDAIDSGVSAN